MEAADEEKPLLNAQTNPQDVGSEYTSDGSVDINKRPALKGSTGRWRACYMILGVEFCECVAFFAVSRNLVTYLTTVLHESKVAAARNVSAWVGASFLTPLIGAFLADTYLGRYWTIVASLPVHILGMLVLAVSASAPASSYSGGEVHRTMVYAGLYLAALGGGGIKPCTSTFGADQFDGADPAELAKKGSFFNWYYFMINLSSLLSSTLLVWLQDNVGWGVSFAIPTALMALALAVFLGGSRVYRFREPTVSPFTSLSQVVVAALSKWRMQLPDDVSLFHELTGSSESGHMIQHTSQFRFLDKAAMMLPHSDKTRVAPPTSSWRLCTVTQVEELKILLRMFPVWASFVIFHAVTGQLSSTFIEQGMVMDNRVGGFAIPPASLSIFGVFSVLVWVPVYETVLVPLARRCTGNVKGFSQTQRLGVGFALSALTMVYSAALETKRLAVARASGLAGQNVPVPMSILWQAPSHVLHGAAGAFAGIGMTEFFYDQAPCAMKSLCAAFAQLSIASGFYFNTVVLSVVAAVTTRGGAPGWIPDNLNEGHLDYFFWMMAALSLLNLAQFVHYSMRCREKTASSP
ncbi:protein NRT1/ PTR FAMILY 8.3-like [Triticum dicoccoides]|uniref:protein NRT1/ PTR FAMILY 8.3-like n=1 Tax=Triticum dicoccoides TaxID=85692 RepID=UPI0018915C37|nr:protein NRT1/ PTR FAMILY 8.3-like [Triticum dicoccoides]